MTTGESMPDVVDITISETDEGRVWASRKYYGFGRQVKAFDAWMHEYELLKDQEEDVLERLRPYEEALEAMYYNARR
jgi:hypothetical protein